MLFGLKLLAPRHGSLTGSIAAFVPGCDTRLHTCFAERIMPDDENWSARFTDGNCQRNCLLLDELSSTLVNIFCDYIPVAEHMTSHDDQGSVTHI